MQRKKPSPDATVTDLEPVESPANSLVPLDTDPRIEWTPLPAHLDPASTQETTGETPAHSSPASTQLLDDEEEEVSTRDELPRVKERREKPASATRAPRKKPVPRRARGLPTLARIGGVNVTALDVALLVCALLAAGGVAWFFW